MSIPYQVGSSNNCLWWKLRELTVCRRVNRTPGDTPSHWTDCDPRLVPRNFPTSFRRGCCKRSSGREPEGNHVHKILGQILITALTSFPVLTLVKFPSAGKSHTPNQILPSSHFSWWGMNILSKSSVAPLSSGTAISPPSLWQSSSDFLKLLRSGMTVRPGITGLHTWSKHRMVWERLCTPFAYRHKKWSGFLWNWNLCGMWEIWSPFRFFYLV